MAEQQIIKFYTEESYSDIIKNMYIGMTYFYKYQANPKD
jgi:hypothetical protein